MTERIIAARLTMSEKDREEATTSEQHRKENYEEERKEEHVNERKVIQKEGCEVFAHISAASWSLCLMPVPKQIVTYTASSLTDEALCVAIKMGDQCLIQGLLATGSSLWKETSLFGYTWVFAALHGGLATFKFLTSVAQVSKDGHVRAGQRAVFGHRMAAVLLHNGADIEDCALQMVGFWLKNLAPPSWPVIKACFEAAIETGATRFIVSFCRDPEIAEWGPAIRHIFLSPRDYPKSVGTIVIDLLRLEIFTEDNINDEQVPMWIIARSLYLTSRSRHSTQS